MGFPGGSEKRLPGMWETREDPLEKEMATHSSTLAWRIPWREEPSRLQSMGSQRVGHNFTFTFPFSAWPLSPLGPPSSPIEGQSGSPFISCQPFPSCESRRQRCLTPSFYQPGCQSLFLSKEGCFLQGLRSGL